MSGRTLGVVTFVWLNVCLAQSGIGQVSPFTPLAMLPNADISVVARAATVPRVHSEFQLELTVWNLGPSDSMHVQVTNQLPSAFALLSFYVGTYRLTRIDDYMLWIYDPESGSCTQDGNTVRCDLNPIPAGWARQILLQVRSDQTGTETNLVSVGDAGVDLQPDNNLHLLPVDVRPVAVSIEDAEVVDEARPTAQATFVVRLSSTNELPVTVDYQTTDSTARAGEDYTPVSGTLEFLPGVTEKIIEVPILDDLLKETDLQHFTVWLDHASQAELGSFHASGAIRDNEPAVQIRILDAPPVLEGDELTTAAIFPVTVWPASDAWIFVHYRTASPPYPQSWDDIVHVDSTFTIPPATTNQLLFVQVRSDTITEETKIFYVRLSDVQSPVATVLDRSEATGTILDDEEVPGKIHHFLISPVASPQIKDRPFEVTVTAVDYLGERATEYPIPWLISTAVRTGNSYQYFSQIIAEEVLNGVWTGTVHVPVTATNADVTAWDPFLRQGTSNPYEVLANPTLFLALPTFGTEGDGTLPGAGEVSITNRDVVDLEVALASSDVLDLELPAMVTIPAGQTSAVFDVTFVDDNRLDATRVTTVTASSPYYVLGSRTVLAHDNESATLGVVLPYEVTEGTGTLIGQGLVLVDQPPDVPIPVRLMSSHPTELVVPSCCVIIPAGQTSVVFSLVLTEDKDLELPETVTVTAQVTNWVDGLGTTTLVDNDPAYLIFVLYSDQQPVLEGSGLVQAGLIVYLSGVVHTNVTVNLLSSDTTELELPASILIPASTGGSHTDISLPDDFEFDGSQSVTISATAPGFSNATLNVTVLDNDVHHLALSNIPSPQTSGVAFHVSLLLKDVNDLTMTRVQTPVSFEAANAIHTTAMSPMVVSNLTRGGWSGAVTVLGWGTNVQWVAMTTNGAVSMSNPFEVLRPAWLTQLRIQKIELDGADVRVSFPSFPGKVYRLERTADLLAPDWTTAADPVPGTGKPLSILDPGAASLGPRFYRLAVDP